MLCTTLYNQYAKGASKGKRFRKGKRRDSEQGELQGTRKMWKPEQKKKSGEKKSRHEKKRQERIGKAVT